MYQFKANGGFGMMHQATQRRMDESSNTRGFKGSDAAAYKLGFQSALNNKPKLSQKSVESSFGGGWEAYLRGYNDGNEARENQKWHDSKKR